MFNIRKQQRGKCHAAVSTAFCFLILKNFVISGTSVAAKTPPAAINALISEMLIAPCALHARGCAF